MTNAERGLYRSLVPRYISDFRNFDVDVMPGFIAFGKDHPHIVELMGVDGLYSFIWDICYPYWWCHRHSRHLKREHTDIEWEAKKEQYDFKCAYCGRGNIKLTKDHIQAITRGGSDDIGNIVPSCMDCNRRKRTKSAVQFRAELDCLGV